MRKNKKPKETLVLIRHHEVLENLSVIQRQLKDDIRSCIKNIPTADNVSAESNKMATLHEYKEELREINEMLKIPFDILVVVEKDDRK